MGIINRILGRSTTPMFFGESFKSEKRSTAFTDGDMGGYYGKKFDFAKHCQRQSYAVKSFPQVKSAVTGIAGQAMGEGTYILPAELVDEDGVTYTNKRSIRAAKLIKQLNKRINIDQIIFDSAFRLAVYGTNFIEKTYTPVFNAQLVNPHHQPNLQPIYEEGTYNIKSWTTNKQNPEKGITYNPKEISVMAWLPDTSWPYGTSMLTGIENEIKALDDLRISAMEFARQNAYPFDIVQVGDNEFQPGDDTMREFKTSIANREAGGVQVTNAPVSGHTVGQGSKGVDFITDQAKFHRDQLSDGLMFPPLSILYSSTEASAKITRSHMREVLINPLHKIFKTKIEKEIYTPYLLDKGYSIRNVPSLMFNIPEMMLSEEIMATVALVTAQIMTPIQASNELGFKYDEAYWRKAKQDEAKLATANREKKEEKSEED